MIYCTTGCIEPAPYGLFDEQFWLTTSTGNEFRLWSEELNHLLGALFDFQWIRKRISLPELPIVSEWNLNDGVFDVSATPSTLDEIPRLIDALRVLKNNYAEYESDGKHHGFTALKKYDLEAFITFLENAQTRNEKVVISEH